VNTKPLTAEQIEALLIFAEKFANHDFLNDFYPEEAYFHAVDEARIILKKDSY
jgi:hypothetical protein